MSASAADYPGDAGEPPAELQAFRRYVTGFVNRHDFAILPQIMRADYTLVTSGHEISGRDGPYSSAVARQMAQFPGLQFTVHDLFVSGTCIGVHFTEHGASIQHGGAAAAWPSIAIYEIRDGLLARCTIEQDYYSRRRQLADYSPVTVATPAIAPWDARALQPCPAGETLVAQWLGEQNWLTDGSVAVDDSHATGCIEPVLTGGPVTLLKILSGRTASGDAKLAFHALQSGATAPGFAEAAGAQPGAPGSLHLSGLVVVRDGRIVSGNIIRDRWGLFRRLSNAARATP